MSDAGDNLENYLNNLFDTISNMNAHILKYKSIELIDDDIKMMCKMINMYRDNFKKLNKEAKLRLLQQGQEVQRLFEKYKDSCDLIPIMNEQVLQTPKENKRTSKGTLPAKPAKLPPLFGSKSNSARVAPIQAPIQSPIQAPVARRNSARVEPERSPIQAPVARRNSARVEQERSPIQAPIQSPIQAPIQSPIQAPIQSPVARRNSARVEPERSPIHSIQPTVPRKRDYLFKFMNYLTIRMKGDKYKKKIEYIHYFDMRFQYFLKFLKNIASILNLYKNFLNPTQLQLINDMINNVVNIRCKWGNITLDENALKNLSNITKLKFTDIRALNSITLSHIIKKIREQNAIIEEFLNAISRILGEDDKLAFIKWINSQFYKDALKRINDFILSHKKTESELERSMREKEVNYQLFSAYNIKPQYTNKYPLYSFDPIKEYNDKREEYIASDYTFRREHSGGGIFWRSTKKVAPEEQRGVPEIKDYEKEEMEVANINLYRTPNIILFFNIMNYVLKYIEVVALYLNTRGGDIGSYEDDLIKINVSLKINKAIEDSKEYKKALIAYNNKNNLFSDVDNSTQIHQSIYLHYYKLSGGRKQRRTVGRPRKTPSKKPIAKPVKKPVAKPVKPATKKPSATKPSIKPAKPTKK